MMHRRVSELTARARKLAEDLVELMPDQYHKQPNTADRWCTAWRNAMTEVVGGWQALGRLGDMLATKVRIAHPSDKLEIDCETYTVAEWSALYDIPAAVILERIHDGMDAETAVTLPLEDMPADDEPATVVSAEEPAAAADAQ